MWPNFASSLTPPHEEVKSGALLRADADKQIKYLQKKAQEEKNKADTELASLKSKIDNARSEAERDRRNALAAQERIYDDRISDLERRLSTQCTTECIHYHTQHTRGYTPTKCAQCNNTGWEHHGNGRFHACSCGRRPF